MRKKVESKLVRFPQERTRPQHDPNKYTFIHKLSSVQLLFSYFLLSNLICYSINLCSTFDIKYYPACLLCGRIIFSIWRTKREGRMLILQCAYYQSGKTDFFGKYLILNNPSATSRQLSVIGWCSHENKQLLLYLIN